jgi:dTMP kinase
VATGKLIVLEGPEGAGKTTQAPLVAAWLAGLGHEVVSFREPGGTAVGDQVRRILLDSPDGTVADAAEALLYVASRAQLVNEEIRPALGRGAMVLLDRFFLSTYAYQIVGRGLPEDEVRAANHLAVGDLVPDLTIMLMLPTAQGLARVAQRGAHDRLERADRAFHERVARAFGTYADAAWQRTHPECGPVVSVDATAGVAEVSAKIRQVLQRRWPEFFARDRLGTEEHGIRNAD